MASLFPSVCLCISVYVTLQGWPSWGPCATHIEAAPSARRMESVPHSPSLMSWAMCRSHHRTNPSLLFQRSTHTSHTALTASLGQQKLSYQECSANTGATHNKVKKLTFNNLPVFNTLLCCSAQEVNPVCGGVFFYKMLSEMSCNFRNLKETVHNFSAWIRAKGQRLLKTHIFLLVLKKYCIYSSSI